MRGERFVLTLFFLTMLAGCDSNDRPQSKDNIVTLSIDSSTKYQTIQGFGGFGAQKVWWADEPFYSDEFVDLIINDLGVTILRDNIPIAFEPKNDNDDPYDLDLSAFNITTDYPNVDSHLGQHFPYLKAMHEAGLEKLIVSIWSPPIWMKYNDHRGNGSDTIEGRTSAPPYSLRPDQTTNQLRTDLYEEFAEYCVAYIRMLKRETGIDLYAISLQNEPRFSQFYASAVHSPESLRDLIRVVGARFETEQITTKIFMPEDVQSIEKVLQYLEAVFEDVDASRYTDIVAIHNYRGDGVQPSEPAPKNWQRTADLAQKNDKEIWMTETSGYEPNTIDGGIALAKSMYNALHYGHVSAWVYWQMSGRHLLNEHGEKTYLYHVSQQFYRHIRPGAIRIDIRSSHHNLLALGFEDTTNKQRTILLINDAEKSSNILLDTLQEDTRFSAYVTSENAFHQPIDFPAGISNTFEVPAKSVVTLNIKSLISGPLVSNLPIQ